MFTLVHCLHQTSTNTVTGPVVFSSILMKLHKGFTVFVAVVTLLHIMVFSPLKKGRMKEVVLKCDGDKKYGTSSVWEGVKNYFLPLESTAKVGIIELCKS